MAQTNRDLMMTDRETRRTSGAISVLMVDDHPMFLDGLRMALELEEDILVVGQCSDGEDALREASAHKPDVILLDINLPSMNGLQVTRLLKSERDDVAVIVLTAYHDAEQVLHAMRAGASAYCAKDITPKELVEIIRSVASGTTLSVVSAWTARCSRPGSILMLKLSRDLISLIPTNIIYRSVRVRWRFCSLSHMV
jgi:DNA-binding NarL/FixJ family response regulator